ncbi:Quinonprotein alcohol dehydrogenase-like superfamily [Elaphomyces granulatus]
MLATIGCLIGGAPTRSRFMSTEQKVNRFLRTHLLHWIEAVALMGKVDEILQMLIDLQSLGRECGTPGLHQLIRDAERVVLRCRSGIEVAPLQIYSAPAFAPRQSEDYWDYSLQTLVGRFDRSDDLALDRHPRQDLAFSSDSRLLFSFWNPNLNSSEGSSSVEIWDMSTGVLRYALPHGRKGKTGYSLENGPFFYEIVDQTMTIWDLQAEIYYTVAGASSDVLCLCVSPDRQLLVTAHGDGQSYTVKCWDLPAGLLSRALDCMLIEDPTIDISPDGRFLAITSERGVEVWDPQTGLRHDHFTQNNAAENYANPFYFETYAFSSDGRLALSSSSFGSTVHSTVQLWNTATGVLSDFLELHTRIHFMVFSPDNHLLAIVAEEQVSLYNSSTDSLSCIVTLPLTTTESLNCLTHVKSRVAFSPPEAHLLAFVCTDGTLLIWNRDRAAVCKNFRDNCFSECRPAFSQDGRLLALSCTDWTVQLWDASSIATTVAADSGDSDGSRGGLKRRLCPTPATRKLIASLPPPAGYDFFDGYCNLAFSADSNLLAIYSQSIIRVWDVGTNKIGATLYHDRRDMVRELMALRFLPNNRTLATCDGYSLYLWEWRTEQSPWILRGPPNRYPQTNTWRFEGVCNHSLASSPDGQLIAAVLQLDTVIVADCIRNLHHTVRKSNSDKNNAIYNAIYNIAISPDKQSLATVGEREIHLVDITTGKLRQSLANTELHVRRPPSTFSKDDIYCLCLGQVAFSPDGQQLAFADRSKIILWDLHALERPQVLHMGRYVDGLVDFSVDGSQLRTCRGVLPLPGASDSLSQPLSTVSATSQSSKDGLPGTWPVSCGFLMATGSSTALLLATWLSLSPSRLPIWIELDPSKRPTGEALVNRFTWVDATDYEIHEPETCYEIHELGTDYEISKSDSNSTSGQVSKSGISTPNDGDPGELS